MVVVTVNACGYGLRNCRISSLEAVMLPMSVPEQCAPVKVNVGRERNPRPRQSAGSRVGSMF